MDRVEMTDTSDSAVLVNDPFYHRSGGRSPHTMPWTAPTLGSVVAGMARHNGQAQLDDVMGWERQP